MRNLALLFVLLNCLLFADTVFSQVSTTSPYETLTDPTLQRLEQHLLRIVLAAEAEVGIAAESLSGCTHIAIAGDDFFPMASVYKIPIAIALLRRVDRGEISLREMVEISPPDLRPGSGMIAVRLRHSGVSLSIQNLLELMLTLSDNTATDALLKVLGGPRAVQRELAALGVKDMRIDRSVLEIFIDWYGLSETRLPHPFSLEGFRRAIATTDRQLQQAAHQRFVQDPRDNTTPNAMVILLTRLFKGQLLKEESTALLLDMMSRCETGANRIPGLLPEGTRVAHKTGTLGSITNDAGIVWLPDGKAFSIAVFIKNSHAELRKREQVIAELARTLFDFFVITDPTTCF